MPNIRDHVLNLINPNPAISEANAINCEILIDVKPLRNVINKKTTDPISPDMMKR
jgi:hypothetical protein